MLRSVRVLNTYSVVASDGTIGHIDDTLFDDLHWTVRYLVVDTGGWLSGRKVLVSPIAVSSIESQTESINTELSKQQVEDSPGIATDPPLSRQMEAEYASYYQYQPYWEGTGVWGLGMYPRPWVMGAPIAPPVLPAGTGSHASMDASAKQQDRHLRSGREVTGYAIEATDGWLGHVDDFLMDDETWTLRYMVVDTGGWWSGKKVLVAPAWIREIDWTSSRVIVDLERDVIKQAPPFDPSRPVGRAYEEELYAYYGRPPYWANGGAKH